MIIKEMYSKVRKADDKLHPLFAIVDAYGHTVIQIPDYKRAMAVLKLLS